MDRKTIIAIALSIVFLIAYQPILRWVGLGKYLEPPRRQPTVAVDTTRHDSAAVTKPGGLASTPAAQAPKLATAPSSLATVESERMIEVETDLFLARFSNRGARLVAVELKHYASAHGVSSRGSKPPVHKPNEIVPPGDRVVLAGGPLFGIDLGSGADRRSLEDVVYTARESLDAAGHVRAITFTAGDSSVRMRQVYRVRPDTYAFDLEVDIQGVPVDWRVSDYSLTARSWPLMSEADLPADHRALRAASMVGTNIHRETPGALQKGAKRFDGAAAWALVQNRYFLGGAAVLSGAARGVESRADKRALTPEELAALPAGSKPDEPVAVNSLVMSLPGSSAVAHHFIVYTGPAEYHRLSALHVGLERVVDLGWRWVLPFSTQLLRLLNWFYNLVRNYGLAIIVLATLVRLLLHPLNVASMKSMRAMQKLQPEMERLKEKYKNDPQAMNTALMGLYKEHKVNPAGGCLPMLIQMPLFLALYQVLFNAIELRQAPFVAWMHDLSAPDKLFEIAGFPIRLLPLLMLGSGLLQQKMTPTDPRQAPTMYMMNAVMTVFFYNLPSGLVLYWTWMNVLTALQQWLVMRGDDAHPAAATVRTGTAPGKRGAAAGAHMAKKVTEK